MEVQIISDTIQKFNNESFYRCGPYFQRKGRRLHRVVWEYHYGDIPSGYHVHHKDGDRANNDISNLTLMSECDHLSLHQSTETAKERSRKSIKIALVKACEWHGSEAGAEFHSRLAKNTWAHKQPVKKICVWCGKEYETRDLGHKKQDVYCCANHKAAALRWRRKHDNQTNYPGRKT